jgi:hypothetical protein
VAEDGAAQASSQSLLPLWEKKEGNTMIDNQPVLTIHRGHRRPSPALVEAFRGAATSHLADAMNGRGALDYRIKPLDPGNARFAGPALTAHAYPADIQGWVGAAMEAQAGDVILCTNEAYTGTALIGDLAAGMMKNKGVAAFALTSQAHLCHGVGPNRTKRGRRGNFPTRPSIYPLRWIRQRRHYETSAGFDWSGRFRTSRCCPNPRSRSGDRTHPEQSCSGGGGEGTERFARDLSLSHGGAACAGRQRRGHPGRQDRLGARLRRHPAGRAAGHGKHPVPGRLDQ